jgi:hypothetical protein
MQLSIKAGGRRRGSNDGHTAVNKKLILLVFSFFLLVNIASTGAHFDWVDGTEAFLVTESMVLRHSAKLYPDIPSIEKLHYEIKYLMPMNKALQTHTAYNPNTPLEPVYLLRSLLLSAIAVPFYYAATILSIPPLPVVGIFVESLLISLTSLVIFCFSFEIYGSRKISFILGLIFGVCSFVWPYNTTLWAQPLEALCIIASAYFIYISLHRRPSCICNYIRQNDKNKNSANHKRDIHYAGLGGLFLGLSVFAHPTSIVVIPAFAMYSIVSMRHNRKSLASFFVVLAITLSFMGLVNYLRFGSFTEFGYGGFSALASHAGWIGLVGLLVSPGVGLIFFFPIAILLPLAFRYMYRENKGLFFLSAYIIVANWLYFGTLSYWEPFAWSGGIAWGPRYFISMLPFITIVSGALLIQLRKPHFKYRLPLKISIITLCGAGFCITLLGKLVWFMYDLNYMWGIEHIVTQWPEMMIWNPSYSTIILHIKMLMSNYVSTIHPEHSLYWTAYGLAPCPVDVYVFCKFGIAPIILLGAAIAILAAIIITGKGLYISKNTRLKNILPNPKIENLIRIRKITENVFSKTSSSSISRDQE